MRKKVETKKYTDDEIAEQLVGLATNQQQVMWILNNDTTVLNNKVEGLQAELSANDKRQWEERLVRDAIEKTYIKVIMALGGKSSASYYD